MKLITHHLNISDINLGHEILMVASALPSKRKHNFMKTKLTILLVFLTSAIFAQTIRRVNADPTVTGINVYNTIQAAHDAASNGDILVVEPGSSVGDLNCLKTLTIYGRGYFLDKNPNYTLLPNNSSGSSIGSISISANNVKISGVICGIITINGGVSGITIARNNCDGGVWVQSATSAPISNITITQNCISGNNAIYIYGYDNTGLVSNVTISNNLLGDLTQSNSLLLYSSYTSNILFNQNIITGDHGPNPFNNSTFTNNIFTYGAISITNANTINTTYNNNVFTGSSTITGNVGTNNTVVANLTSLFVSNSGGSSDNNYRVSNGTVLKTAGTSGGEVGMFGGSTPYIQYGIPAAPSVIKLLNTGLGNATTPITTTIGASSNN